MIWYFVFALLIALVVHYWTNRKEKLTMMTERKIVDGWGNVTITP
jgi:hypothetical protein